MNSLSLAVKNSLESWGVVSPFNLTSDCGKNVSTTDSIKIITNAFKDEKNSIWREKVVALDRLLKKVCALPVGSLVDAHNNVGIIGDVVNCSIFLPGVIITVASSVKVGS